MVLPQWRRFLFVATETNFFLSASQQYNYHADVVALQKLPDI